MSHFQAPRPSIPRITSASTTAGESSASTTSATASTSTTTSPQLRTRRLYSQAAAPSAASLIPLNPLIDTSLIPSHPIEEAEKCWICFGSQDEETPAHPSTNGIWRSPCKCALIAHEGCLLDWIAELEKGTSYNKAVKCPQCKTEIKLRQEASWSVDIGRRVETLVSRGTWLAVVAGMASCVGSVVFITCTVYGVNAVYLICGTEQANAILLSANGTEFEWTWRLGLGLPLVPIVLICSRTRLLDATYPILPIMFFCHLDPLHIAFPPSPAITLAVLPYIRGLYNTLYDRLLAPWDRKWSAELERSNTGVEEGEGEVGAELVIEEVEDEAVRENGAADADAWNAPDIGVRRDRNVINLNTGHGTAIVGALLFPTVMAGMGAFLGKFPGVKRYLPDTFHRNILGGCLFVLLKDLFTLYYKYKRARQRRTRTIVDYKEVPGSFRRGKKPTRTQV